MYACIQAAILAGAAEEKKALPHRSNVLEGREMDSGWSLAEKAGRAGGGGGLGRVGALGQWGPRRSVWEDG